MGTNFTFYNQTRNQEGERPADPSGWRNIERYGYDVAKHAFEMVIETNRWDRTDEIVAVGDSWGAELVYENGHITGLDSTVFHSPGTINPCTLMNL